mgnify:CR=1 FL=1
MSIKYDGKIIKSGYSVVANTKDGCNLRKGSSGGGPVIGNIKDGKNIRDGQSSGGKILCNIRDGKNIRDGQSSGGKRIKIRWQFGFLNSIQISNGET